MASLTDECSTNKKFYLEKQIKEENNQGGKIERELYYQANTEKTTDD
jgi:hypothetical protein